MPIITDDAIEIDGDLFDSTDVDASNLEEAKAPKPAKTKPTFFHADLTGTGKSAQGALNRNVNPQMLNPLLDEQVVNTINEMHTSHNGEIKVRFIPTATLCESLVEEAMRAGHTMSIAQPEHRVELGRHTMNNGTEYIFSCAITPQAIRLRQEGDLTSGRSVIVRYRLDLYGLAFADGTEAIYTDVFRPMQMSQVSGNYATTRFSANPIRTLFALVNTMKLPFIIDEDAFNAAMDDYNVVPHLIEQAEGWKGDATLTELTSLVPQMAAEVNASQKADSPYDIFRRQIRYMESHAINLDTYHKLYATMREHFDRDVVIRISKINMNLLLADTVENLRDAKPHIPMLPDIKITMNPFFSKQQQEIISTREPFVIVDAGAGSGKSTTLDGILDGLNQFGVPDHDMLVTSFTNTAADNMKAKRPNIRTMTMASMIHEIYSTNFPNHELSSMETLANCLRIALPNSTVARDLETRLFATQNKKGLGPFTELSSFIEANYEEVMQCLDAVRQTTLELESIICYQRIDEINEPNHIRTSFMLIDEVQDNSVFEFIYVLKRAAKYKQHLYLIGDPSQVLYEFRNANPKALNTMESSGVFATFKLTTNYRSNQDILNFANKFLLDIEANQFAQIQLHSHKIEPQTVATLKERVKVKHIRVNKLADFNDGFETIVGRAMSDFVDAAIDRQEKVVFLARTRKHAQRFQEMLRQSYPHLDVSSMVPEVAYTYTAFTEYIRRYWDSVTALSPDKVAFVVYDQMKKEAEKLMRRPSDAAKSIHLNHVDQWWITNGNAINAWVAATKNGSLSRDEFFEYFKNSMVNYEINTNKVRQSVVSQRNQVQKEKNQISNAPFIVSTIHSIKGLEFDNAVVIYESKQPMSEEMKRAYYVAFTRAKNQLLVIGYGTDANPAITTNYTSLMKELEDIEAENAARGEAEMVEDDVLLAAHEDAETEFEEESAAFDATSEDAMHLIGGFSVSDNTDTDDEEIA